MSYLTKMTWCWIILTVILLLTGRWGRQKSPVPPSSPSSLRRNRCSSTKDLTLSNLYSGKLQQKVSMGNYELNSKYDFDVIFDSLRKPEHHFFFYIKQKQDLLQKYWKYHFDLDCFVRSLTFNVSRLVRSIIQNWI